MNPTTISSPKAWARAGNASATRTQLTSAQLRRTSDVFIESPLSVREPLANGAPRSHVLVTTSFRALCLRGGSSRGERAGTKPPANAERISPQNALRSKDHHQDDDAAPDLPAPVRQELQRGRKVRDDERAQQGTVQNVHASEHHVHRDVDAALEVEVVVLDEHGMVSVQATANPRRKGTGHGRQKQAA